MKPMKRVYLVSATFLALALAAGCQTLALKKGAKSPPDSPATELTQPPGQSQAPRAAAATPAAQQVTSVDFRLAQEQQDNGLLEYKFQDGSAVWYLPDPVFNRADLSNAEPRKANDGRAFVRFTFNPQGAQKLASITERYPGKYLILTLNNSLQALYQINAPLTNGVLDIGFSSEQAAVDAVNEIAGRKN